MVFTSSDWTGEAWTVSEATPPRTGGYDLGGVADEHRVTFEENGADLVVSSHKDDVAKDVPSRWRGQRCTFESADKRAVTGTLSGTPSQGFRIELVSSGGTKTLSAHVHPLPLRREPRAGLHDPGEVETGTDCGSWTAEEGSSPLHRRPPPQRP